MICFFFILFCLLFACMKSKIFLERMILPRIRDNLRNHSQFDLQRDGINELICIADAYPEAEIFWLRGWFFHLTCYFIWFFFILNQHQIWVLYHEISHERNLHLRMKCMEWIIIFVKQKISMVWLKFLLLLQYQVCTK